MNRKPLAADQFTHWEVGNEYKLIKVLGQGSYGQVASALHIPSNKNVAIKRMTGVFEVEEDCKRILREIQILMSLQNQYVVGLFDIIQPPNPEDFFTIYIVLNLSESDLKKVIKSAIYLE